MDENRYINLERSWWRDIEEDAENIGIRITNFDDKFCYGHLIDDAEESIDRVRRNHGEHCETYNIASKFEPLFIADHAARRLQGYQDWQRADAVLTEKYLKFMLAEYRRMIDETKELLTSEEEIAEYFNAKGYEFFEDGGMYDRE